MTAKPTFSTWLRQHQQRIWIGLAFSYGILVGGFGILVGVAERILRAWATATNVPPPLNMPLYEWSDDIMAYYLAGGLSLVALLVVSLCLWAATRVEAQDKA